MKKLIGMICFLLAGQLAAAPIAKVLFTKNTANLVRGGASSKLMRGKDLQVGDEIITDATGGAQIRYQNGTIVAIGDGSDYKILAYSPKKNEVNIKAELKVGKLHSTTVGGNKKEELKTPTIAMAILGTDYQVYVPCMRDTTNRMRRPCVASGAGEKMYVKVNSGKVMAGNKTIPVGQGVLITPEGMSKATFPPEGRVAIVPTMETREVTGIANTNSSVEETNTLEITQIVSTVNTGSTEAVQQASLLDIAVLSCATAP